MNNDEFDGDINNWNIYTIIKYVKVHFVQFLLLLLVFIIIYVVDHISNINAMIFAMPSAIPALSTPAASKNTIPIKIKKPKKLKK
jgi:hypothetical protein